MKNWKNYVFAFAPAIFGVLAIIMAFLPGLVSVNELFGTTITSTVSMYTIIFGGGDLVVTSGSDTVTSNFTGGLSYFALIAFIFVVLAIIINVTTKFIKLDKKVVRYVPFVVAGLFLLAGIFAFMAKVAGSNVESVSFADAYNGFNLGVGTILFAIFAIFASVASVAPYFIARFVRK